MINSNFLLPDQTVVDRNCEKSKKKKLFVLIEKVPSKMEKSDFNCFFEKSCVLFVLRLLRQSNFGTQKLLIKMAALQAMPRTKSCEVMFIFIFHSRSFLWNLPGVNEKKTLHHKKKTCTLTPLTFCTWFSSMMMLL